MKNKSCFIVYVFLLIGSYCNAQYNKPSKYDVMENVKNSIIILDSKGQYKDSSKVKDAYITLINYYCYAKEYQEDLQKNLDGRTLIQLIDANKQDFEDLYLGVFLLNKSGCFSKEEFNLTRKTLSSILTPSSEYFYELVGLFQLNQFNEYIESKADSSWFSSFSQALDSGFLSRKIINEALPLITLANLGDEEIENRILEILLNQYKSFNILSPNKKEISKQYFFYQNPLGGILSKLYSKKSIKSTLVMLDSYFSLKDFFELSDQVIPPNNYIYINSVILNKLHPIYQYYFKYELLLPLTALKLEDQKKLIAKLKEDIINDKIEWSNLYKYRK